MMNVVEINGVKAVIAYDPEINMFRYIWGVRCTDFYSADIEGLRREGKLP